MGELAVVRSKLADEDIKKLEEETSALRAAQAAHDDPADLAKLPTLSTDDLERASKPVPIEVAALDIAGAKATLLTHELPTDGLVSAGSKL